MSAASRGRRFGAAVVLAVSLAGAASQAGTEGSGWFARNQLAGRINPFGLFDEGRLGYRFAFESSVLRSLGVAGNASVSPAFARGGAAVDVQLGSMLNVSAIYEAGASFGNLGLEESFSSAGAAQVKAPDPTLMFSSSPGSYATWHQQLILGALVSATYGKVIVKSNNRFVFQRLGLRRGDHVFYDANWEVLGENDGWLYVNDVDLLVQALPGLRAGVRYDLTHAFIVEQPAGATTQRLGPLVSYLFFEKPHAAFNSPTLSLVVNWWLQRAFATGTSPALPFVGLAFSFKSEL